jgi:hypothetical protein
MRYIVLLFALASFGGFAGCQQANESGRPLITESHDEGGRGGGGY